MIRRFVMACALLLIAVPADARQATVALPACAVPVAADSDADGLGDLCELELARTFAPVLSVRLAGCNIDDEADPPRLGGGYFFAVQPGAAGAVRIAYMPAYFEDCGWRGAKCLIPLVNCAPHPGDSELIVVEAAAADQTGEWHATAVFLSAHCFGRSMGSCRWYRGRELARLEWSGAAPVVWVAEGRHANYPSRRACDRGHGFIDTCDRHETRYAFPIRSDGNIGSRSFPAEPGGCHAAESLGSSRVAPGAVECLWRSDAPFRGWQARGPGVTSYERYLREIVGF
jgi:hypothetical protein